MDSSIRIGASLKLNFKFQESKKACLFHWREIRSLKITQSASRNNFITRNLRRRKTPSSILANPVKRLRLNHIQISAAAHSVSVPAFVVSHPRVAAVDAIDIHTYFRFLPISCKPAEIQAVGGEYRFDSPTTRDAASERGTARCAVRWLSTVKIAKSI